MGLCNRHILFQPSPLANIHRRVYVYVLSGLISNKRHVKNIDRKLQYYTNTYSKISNLRAQRHKIFNELLPKWRCRELKVHFVTKCTTNIMKNCPSWSVIRAKVITDLTNMPFVNECKYYSAVKKHPSVSWRLCNEWPGRNWSNLTVIDMTYRECYINGTSKRLGALDLYDRERFVFLDTDNPILASIWNQ